MRSVEIMLYKKSTLGRKYMKLITGSSGFFITFVLWGLILFLFLTITTRVDVVKTYLVEPITVESGITLLIKNSDVSVGSAYLYSNKNEVVYPVLIEKVEPTREGSTLYLNTDGLNIIKSLGTADMFIDIPQGKETLLSRIFTR